jgi:hypothetical protein
MKRRLFMTALATAPAASVVLAQAPIAAPAADPESTLKFAVSDDAADTVLKFFDQRQFATLRRLSDALVPRIGTNPSATETRAPEFLDFLLSESPVPRQQLWLAGLDTLEYQSETTLRKAFAQTTKAEVDILLAPLREPWTYTAPSTLAEFLRAAKRDIRTATTNSREYALARGGPGGQYWKAVD